jgi:hypothetical protein
MQKTLVAPLLKGQLRKLLYTTAETQAVGGFRTTRLYQLINEGVLKAVRLGHRTYITADSLEAFVVALPPVITPTMAKAAHEKWSGHRKPEVKTHENDPDMA